MDLDCVGWAGLRLGGDPEEPEAGVGLSRKVPRSVVERVLGEADEVHGAVGVEAQEEGVAEDRPPGSVGSVGIGLFPRSVGRRALEGGVVGRGVR